MSHIYCDPLYSYKYIHIYLHMRYEYVLQSINYAFKQALKQFKSFFHFTEHICKLMPY